MIMIAFNFKKNKVYNWICIIFLLFVPIKVISQPSPTYSESLAVKELSDKYREAIKSSSGENVIPLVSQNSIQFYSKLKELALWAESEELFKEEIYVIMTTLTLKKAYSFSNLKNLSPRELIIDNYTGQTSTLNKDDTIQINSMMKPDPNRIIVTYVSPQNGSSINLAYIKENGRWKVNLDDQMSLMWFPLQLKYTRNAHKRYSKKEFIIKTANNFGMSRSEIITPLLNQ